MSGRDGHALAFPRPDRPGSFGGSAAAHGMGRGCVGRAVPARAWTVRLWGSVLLAFGLSTPGNAVTRSVDRRTRTGSRLGSLRRHSAPRHLPTRSRAALARPSTPCPSPLFPRRALRRWPDESERDEDKRGRKDRDKDWEIFLRGITPPSWLAWHHPSVMARSLRRAPPPSVMAGPKPRLRLGV